MKIAINTLPLQKTKVGMGKYIVELVNRVPKQDKNNEYLIYVSPQNRHFFRFDSTNVTIREVPSFWSNRVIKLLWEQVVLPWELWINSVSVYHAPGFALPIWKSGKVKYLVTIADLTFFSHPQYHMKTKNLYFRKMIPLSIRKADAVITISENTKKDVLKRNLCHAKKIHTIYLAADNIFIPIMKEKRAVVEKKYGVSTPYILFVGMLEPRKNITGLLQAYARLKGKEQYKLVVVGKKGWMYEEIFQKVKVLKIEKNVKFLGYVQDEDLPALYSGASCFVYPSFYEGFGIPIVEAMACKCPVIVSGNSSMEEIGGDAPIFIDPYDYKTIKDALAVVLHNEKKRKEMIKKGEEQARKFSWDVMAKETVALYNSC